MNVFYINRFILGFDSPDTIRSIVCNSYLELSRLRLLKQELTNYLKYCVLRIYIVDEIKFCCHGLFTNLFSVKPGLPFFMLHRGNIISI